MRIGWVIRDLLTSKKHVTSESLALLPETKLDIVNLVKESANLTTEEQWKFLHKLSQKVFTFLQSKSKINNKENVIKWLKNKFSSSLENDFN